jgi:hypothetical protein
MHTFFSDDSIPFCVLIYGFTLFLILHLITVAVSLVALIEEWVL